MQFINDLLADPATLVCAGICVLVLAFGTAFLVLHTRLVQLVFKNLRRNLVRTVLTCSATMVLVFMITMIWTVLYFLDLVTRERARDLKLIVSERWQVPSMLPMTHADYLDPGNPKFLPELRGIYGPDDFMTWSFYGGTQDPRKLTPENLVFFFTMDPLKIRPMMDELENLDPELIKKMTDPRKPEAVLIGSEKLVSIGMAETFRQKGSARVKLTSINYKDLDLEVEIVGVLPDGRYNQSAIMRTDYFNAAFDQYARDKGRQHDLSGKRMNLIWIRVPDRATFDKVGSIIENATVFDERPLKCETASSGIGAFLDAYRDILAGVRWLLVPAILVIMSLVMANAISITVRERRTEMAVMKVLGYRPNQILQLVLGEALLVGAASGLIAATATYAFFNLKWGGIPFRIGFFPVFRIPEFAIIWGLAIGSTTAFLGSFMPALTARSVKVSEVFSRVA
jgi:putative ABC transport system permease protein